MKDNKGFTLIELLAVIVILAAIILTTTPVITSLIEKAKQRSFKTSVQGIIKAAEQQYTQEMFDNTNSEVIIYTYEFGVETASNNKKLEYKGHRPKSGTITVTHKGEISLSLYNGKYCVTKAIDTNHLILKKSTEEDCVTSYTCGNDVVDFRDDEVYKTVKIGEQCWFAENLRYKKDGCLSKTWDATEPHDACMTHVTTQGEELLYQWGAAMNGSAEEGSQGICPVGWYIPTDNDWNVLADLLGENAGEMLKSATEFDGTDIYGFNAIPSGYRYITGNIIDVGNNTGWWTSLEEGADAWLRDVWIYYSGLDPSLYKKASGYSIRCIKR